MTCARCKDQRWVCENHDGKAWPDDCDCGAGMPCPDCNNEPGEFPDPMPGSVTLWSIWSDAEILH